MFYHFKVNTLIRQNPQSFDIVRQTVGVYLCTTLVQMDGIIEIAGIVADVHVGVVQNWDIILIGIALICRVHLIQVGHLSGCPYVYGSIHEHHLDAFRFHFG